MTSIYKLFLEQLLKFKVSHKGKLIKGVILSDLSYKEIQKMASRLSKQFICDRLKKPDFKPSKKAKSKPSKKTKKFYFTELIKHKIKAKYKVRFNMSNLKAKLIELYNRYVASKDMDKPIEKAKFIRLKRDIPKPIEKATKFIRLKRDIPKPVEKARFIRLKKIIPKPVEKARFMRLKRDIPKPKVINYQIEKKPKKYKTYEEKVDDMLSEMGYPSTILPATSNISKIIKNRVLNFELLKDTRRFLEKKSPAYYTFNETYLNELFDFVSNLPEGILKGSNVWPRLFMDPKNTIKLLNRLYDFIDSKFISDHRYNDYLVDIDKAILSYNKSKANLNTSCMYGLFLHHDATLVTIQFAAMACQSLLARIQTEDTKVTAYYKIYDLLIKVLSSLKKKPRQPRKPRKPKQPKPKTYIDMTKNELIKILKSKGINKKGMASLRKESLIQLIKDR
jgi:hypothetical protein